MVCAITDHARCMHRVCTDHLQTKPAESIALQSVHGWERTNRARSVGGAAGRM